MNGLPFGGTSATTTATTGPATTGRATTGPITTGPVTTSSATSSATSGTSSGTTGEIINVSDDLVVIARGPVTIPQSGSFTVSLAYRVPAGRDITIDILDSVNFNWFGKGVATVLPGKGTVVITVNIQNNPPRGGNYILNVS